MSYLDKLSIQGIRSFDPNVSQSVKFYPLTLILGSNGAGKTSIIEALKYVTTGEKPPNSNGGKTFVLDPNVAKTTTVRAQVKLRFNDVERKDTVITRSLELNQKKGRQKQQQLTLKQLNAVIRRDGKAIDQRCNDINNEMLNLLGVSKAVLTNVIFCHQEDCNWPLSEGKLLKEKFDDIFGSLGYVKALDKIKKLRKSEAEKQRLFEKELELRLHLKQEADAKKTSLSKLQSQLSVHKENITKSDSQLTKIKSELNDILSKEDSLQQIDNKIASTEASIKAKEQMLNQIKKNIKSLFSGTEDELKSEINNFEANAKTAKENKNSLMIKQLELSREFSKLNGLHQNMSQELTKLQFSEEQYKALLNQISQMVSKIQSETSLSISPQIITKIDAKQELDSNDISIVLKVMSDQLLTLNKELNHEKSVRNNTFDVMSKELNECKALKSNYEHEVQLWETDLLNKQRSLADIQRKIANSGLSESQYNSLNNDIKRLGEQIKQLDKTDIESTKRDVIQLESDKKRLKYDINILEEKLKKTHEQNQERIKLEILKKDKSEKELKAQQISEVHNDVMQSVGAIEGEFHSSLSNHMRNLSLNMEKKVNSLSRNENELTSKVTRVDIKQETVRKKKQQLNELETRLKRVCLLNDYENTLMSTENELKDLRIQLSDIGSFEPFLKKQIDSIEKTDCCPVCERDMNFEWNAKNGNKLNKEEVKQKLEKQVTQTPDTIEELKKKIKEKESLYKSLLDLRSVVTTIRDLAKEIPKIESEINNSIEVNNNQRKSNDKEKLEINKLKSEFNSLQSVIQDASDYDNCFREIKELDQKINDVFWKFDESCGNIEDISNELQQKKDNYDNIDSQITKNQEMIAKHSDNYNKLQNSLQSCERKKLDIEREQQEKITNVKKVEDIQSQIKVLDNNIMESQMKAMALNPKIDEIESQKSELMNELKEFERKIQTQIQLIKEKQKDIERHNKEIENYRRSGKSDKIIELNIKLSEMKKEISRVETDRTAVSEDINKISEEISSVEVRKRELEDNRQVFTYENEIKDQRVVVENERKKLGFHDLKALTLKKRELEREEKKLEAIRQQSIGKQMPILENIASLEKDLKKAEYKNADNNFKEKSIDLKISELSGEDLNKYYKALDFAISAFHKRKMDEINKLVKGFWKRTYRGHDIDFIKITCDEEERSANDKRRNFNYRVVMVKGETEMDMRGRCSAGQKVLASLIIRLALAEIFCTNCCVLALDEPTTNLDKDNISSFAIAITEIIKNRNKWNNSSFQLIIITHDEEFKSCLDRVINPYFYKVFKNDLGFSNIIRKSIDDNYEDNNEDNYEDNNQ